jgi:hypothetical protein
MPTQLRQVREPVAATTRPPTDVMHIGEQTLAASRESTPAIASPHRPLHPGGDRLGLLAHLHRLAQLVDQHRDERRITRDPTRRIG